MSASYQSQRKFLRLTKSQRIQHALLFSSTGLLVITGFMVEAEPWVINLFGDAGDVVFRARSWIHRIAGVVSIAVCLYHIGYVMFTAEGRSWVKDILPRPKDLVDAAQNVSFMLGFRDSKPKMDRFFYLEKLEYWSVWFGMFIVIVTGIILWLEYLWPKFLVDVASLLHYCEATLAAMAIIVGHIFAVHYNPHVYPMNRAFIDGMINEDLMKDEHGLWYEELMRKENLDR